MAKNQNKQKRKIEKMTVGRPFSLPPIVWQDLDHYEQDLGGGNWKRWGVCKLYKTRFNASST